MCHQSWVKKGLAKKTLAKKRLAKKGLDCYLQLV